MGAVLCGGESKRFGQPKAIAELDHNTLLGQVGVRALRSAGIDPVVAVGGCYSSQLGIPTIPDRWPGEGPLAGVVSALLYATQPHVLVIPCDLPLLSSQHIVALGQPTDNNSAIVSRVAGVVSPSIGIWPIAWARDLVTELRAGKRRLHDLLEMGPYTSRTLPADALLDADTAKELEQLLSRSKKGNL